MDDVTQLFPQLSQTPNLTLLWNTVYLERATNALQGNGQPPDEALVPFLSPLGWEHINLAGDYLWRHSARLGAGKFRPLRPPLDFGA